MGSADWLRMYAQRLEDEHAPHNLSIGMRAAADQMDEQREAALQLLGQVGQLSDEISRLKDGEARLRAALRPLACTCKAKHQAECSRAEVDCPFWNARAALEGPQDRMAKPLEGT